jgi:hypothetical protein
LRSFSVLRTPQDDELSRISNRWWRGARHQRFGF